MLLNGFQCYRHSTLSTARFSVKNREEKKGRSNQFVDVRQSRVPAPMKDRLSSRNEEIMTTNPSQNLPKRRLESIGECPVKRKASWGILTSQG